MYSYNYFSFLLYSLQTPDVPLDSRPVKAYHWGRGVTGVKREGGGGNFSGMVSSDVMVDLGVKQIVSGGKHTLVLTMAGSVFSLDSTTEGDYIPTV